MKASPFDFTIGSGQWVQQIQHFTAELAPKYWEYFKPCSASENLARWIWDRLQPRLPLLSEISVAETCLSRCVYRGQ